jgi:F-type H+-transporting ATPase subunit alpha
MLSNDHSIMKSFQTYLNTSEEMGFVEQCDHSIVYASGLPNATVNEIVVFETGETGVVLSLTPDHAEVLLFSKYSVKVGTRVTRTGEKQEMPVGFELLGQVVDPFGNPLDAAKTFNRPNISRPIDTIPVGISARKRIDATFETGVTIVDFLVPLGKGQRELIIGDRKTGKTSFLYQTILKQAKLGTICIYAAIGKKKIDIRKAEEFFQKNGITQNTVIIASSSDDPAGSIYLTPYCAMTLAEYFRDEGHDVFVVLDDLYTHAKFYREIMLIGRRFPGRNAYPADIFYAHARLLERAGNFLSQNGEGHSITCFPVVESAQGDIAGFIQTNLMSITDGHIYFDLDLFVKGKRPAINPFISVSRVGRQTQTSLQLTLNRELVSFLTLYNRLEGFSHFSDEAGPETARTLSVGERISTFFTQGTSDITNLDLQLIIFGLLWQNATNAQLDVKKMQKAYEDNIETQTFIRDIVTNSATLNDMLDLINKKRPDLLRVLGMSGS